MPLEPSLAVMIFLLQAQVDPVKLGEWMQVLFYAFAGIGSILVAIRFFLPHPPEYKTAIATVRKEQQEADDRIRKDVEEKTTQLHGRISGLRDEIRADLKQNTDEVRSAAKEMQATFNTTVGKLGEITGELSQMNQRTHSLERKVDHHIATDKA